MEIKRNILDCAIIGFNSFLRISNAVQSLKIGRMKENERAVRVLLAFLFFFATLTYIFYRYKFKLSERMALQVLVQQSLFHSLSDNFYQISHTLQN